MKINWFGNSCFRIYMGGQIVVTDPELALAGVSRAEILAGADHVVVLNGGTTAPTEFSPEDGPKARSQNLLNDPEQEKLAILSVSDNGMLLDAQGEKLLTVLRHPIPNKATTKFSGVVVLYGPAEGIEMSVADVLASGSPAVVALAVDALLETQMTPLASLAQGVTLQVLEPRLALEA